MSTVEGYYNHPHVAAQLFPNYEAAMRDGLYGLGDLGGFEDDLKRIFGLIPGASSGYTSLVALIQQKAKEGAEAAIPKIKHEVEATVRPFVIVAGLLGLAGFLFGFSAYMTARKR